MNPRHSVLAAPGGVRLVCVATLIAALACTAWPACANENRRPVTITYTAAQATVEQRDETDLGRGLENIKDDVSHLRYDTYRLVRKGDARAPYGEETELALNDRYTLYVTPLDKERGRIRAEIRVSKRLDVRDDDGERKVVTALRTTSALVPGDALCVGGFTLDAGELVIVLRLDD